MKTTASLAYLIGDGRKQNLLIASDTTKDLRIIVTCKCHANSGATSLLKINIISTHLIADKGIMKIRIAPRSCREIFWNIQLFGATAIASCFNLQQIETILSDLHRI